jgi:hypothetical protein
MAHIETIAKFGSAEHALNILQGLEREGSLRLYRNALWNWTVAQNAEGPQDWCRDGELHWLTPPTSCPLRLVALGECPTVALVDYDQGASILESLGYKV